MRMETLRASLTLSSTLTMMPRWLLSSSLVSIWMAEPSVSISLFPELLVAVTVVVAAVASVAEAAVVASVIEVVAEAAEASVVVEVDPEEAAAVAPSVVVALAADAEVTLRVLLTLAALCSE